MKRRYDDKFRASAVLMLQAAGWPEQVGALTRVADELGVSRQNLTNWATGILNPPPQDVLHEKELDLRAIIEKELNAIGAELPSARKEADYRALITAFGIMFDKKRLLDGLPTQIIEVIPQLTQLIELMQANDHTPADVFQRMINRYHDVDR